MAYHKGSLGLPLGVPKGPCTPHISFAAHLEGGLNKIMDILVGGPELRINARSPVRSRTAQEGKARPGRGTQATRGGGGEAGPYSYISARSVHPQK